MNEKPPLPILGSPRERVTFQDSEKLKLITEGVIKHFTRFMPSESLGVLETSRRLKQENFNLATWQKHFDNKNGFLKERALKLTEVICTFVTQRITEGAEPDHPFHFMCLEFILWLATTLSSLERSTETRKKVDQRFQYLNALSADRTLFPKGNSEDEAIVQMLTSIKDDLFHQVYSQCLTSPYLSRRHSPAANKTTQKEDEDNPATQVCSLLRDINTNGKAILEAGAQLLYYLPSVCDELPESDIHRICQNDAVFQRFLNTRFGALLNILHQTPEYSKLFNGAAKPTSTPPAVSPPTSPSLLRAGMHKNRSLSISQKPNQGNPFFTAKKELDNKKELTVPTVIVSRLKLNDDITLVEYFNNGGGIHSCFLKEPHLKTLLKMLTLLYETSRIIVACDETWNLALRDSNFLSYESSDRQNSTNQQISSLMETLKDYCETLHNCQREIGMIVKPEIDWFRRSQQRSDEDKAWMPNLRSAKASHKALAQALNECPLLTESVKLLLKTMSSPAIELRETSEIQTYLRRMGTVIRQTQAMRLELETPLAERIPAFVPIDTSPAPSPRTSRARPAPPTASPTPPRKAASVAGVAAVNSTSETPAAATETKTSPRLALLRSRSNSNPAERQQNTSATGTASPPTSPRTGLKKLFGKNREDSSNAQANDKKSSTPGSSPRTLEKTGSAWPEPGHVAVKPAQPVQAATDAPQLNQQNAQTERSRSRSLPPTPDGQSVKSPPTKAHNAIKQTPARQAADTSPSQTKEEETIIIRSAAPRAKTPNTSPRQSETALSKKVDRLILQSAAPPLAKQPSATSPRQFEVPLATNAESPRTLGTSTQLPAQQVSDVLPRQTEVPPATKAESPRTLRTSTQSLTQQVFEAPPREIETPPVTKAESPRTLNTSTPPLAQQVSDAPPRQIEVPPVELETPTTQSPPIQITANQTTDTSRSQPAAQPPKEDEAESLPIVSETPIQPAKEDETEILTQSQLSTESAQIVRDMPTVKKDGAERAETSAPSPQKANSPIKRARSLSLLGRKPPQPLAKPPKEQPVKEHETEHVEASAASTTQQTIVEQGSAQKKDDQPLTRTRSPSLGRMAMKKPPQPPVKGAQAPKAQTLSRKSAPTQPLSKQVSDAPPSQSAAQPAKESGPESAVATNGNPPVKRGRSLSLLGRRPPQPPIKTAPNNDATKQQPVAEKEPDILEITPAADTPPIDTPQPPTETTIKDDNINTADHNPQSLSPPIQPIPEDPGNAELPLLPRSPRSIRSVRSASFFGTPQQQSGASPATSGTGVSVVPVVAAVPQTSLRRESRAGLSQRPASPRTLKRKEIRAALASHNRSALAHYDILHPDNLVDSLQLVGGGSVITTSESEPAKELPKTEQIIPFASLVITDDNIVEVALRALNERPKTLLLHNKNISGVGAHKLCEFLLCNYEVLSWSALPGKDPQKAVSGKIYLSVNGDYYIRDLIDPKGIVHTGSLSGDSRINIPDIKANLNDGLLKSKLLAITAEKGHTRTRPLLETLNLSGNKTLFTPLPTKMADRAKGTERLNEFPAATAISELLEWHTTLKVLSLSECNIPQDNISLCFMSSGLRRNASLEFLDLSGNLLNDEAAIHICRALEDHHSLSILLLNDNNFSENETMDNSTSGAWLLELVTTNTNITFIELSGNKLSAATIEKIEAQVQKNATRKDTGSGNKF